MHKSSVGSNRPSYRACTASCQTYGPHVHPSIMWPHRHPLTRRGGLPSPAVINQDLVVLGGHEPDVGVVVPASFQAIDISKSPWKDIRTVDVFERWSGLLLTAAIGPLHPT